MSCGHVSTAREKIQNKNPDPETLLAADQGHQEKQCKPTRSMLKNSQSVPEPERGKYTCNILQTSDPTAMFKL